jgi:hypothetical protein
MASQFILPRFGRLAGDDIGLKPFDVGERQTLDLPVAEKRRTWVSIRLRSRARVFLAR